MINYLIVDDEPQARKLLLTYLQEIPSFKLVKPCANAIEAYETLQLSHIDLIFLDIKMPLISGTDFLRSLKNPPLVIFTTAFNKYALEGYELNVIDYLLKPIALPRLLAALEKVKDRLEKTKPALPENNLNSFFVKVEHKLIKINYDDILLVEGMQNYVKIHLNDKILVANYTMKVIQSLLPTTYFIRINRSVIIPLHSILSIDGNVIETTYQKVQIGVSYRAEVLNFLKNNG